MKKASFLVLGIFVLFLTFFGCSSASKSTTTPAIEPDVIRKILMDNLQNFTKCYQNTLNSSKQGLNAMIPVSFTIGPSGSITKTSVDTEIFPVEFKECILNVIRGIKFPAPLNGGTVDVNQPMNFYQK